MEMPNFGFPPFSVADIFARLRHYQELPISWSGIAKDFWANLTAILDVEPTDDKLILFD